MGNNKQRNSQIANQMRALDVATKFENLKICERNNGLSSPQLKNSSNNKNTVKSIAWWSVWKKWCLEKGIVKEEGNCLLVQFC